MVNLGGNELIWTGHVEVRLSLRRKLFVSTAHALAEANGRELSLANTGLSRVNE
jgi:hypothetical protein